MFITTATWYQWTRCKCGTPYQLRATQKKHDTLVEIVFELTAIVGSHTRLNLNQSQPSFKL